MRSFLNQFIHRSTWVMLLISALIVTGCQHASMPLSETDSPDPDPVDPNVALTCGDLEIRTPTSTERLICASVGGHICLPDNRVCLEFPPGALDVDRRIKLTTAGPEFEVDNKNLLFPGARLEPAGLGFLKPVKVVARPQGASNIDDVSLLLASASDSSEEVLNVSTDPATGTVSGEIWHFSWLYPYFVGTTPAAALPSLSAHGAEPDPSSPTGFALTPPLAAAGNGGSGTLGVSVVRENGVWVWRSGGNNFSVLVLQANFPVAASGQKVIGTVSMIDPGPYTGVGPNARQRWMIQVFNVVLGVMRGVGQPTGADGISIHPTAVNAINWDLLPAGYPSGSAQVDLEFFDAGQNLIGTSTLLLTIARPSP